MDLLTEIMNFINDNYLKLVIGLVLILMAIIGYYAEKTGFGNKLKKEKKENDENDENKVDIDNIGLNDFVDNNSIVANDDSLVKNQDINNENIIQQQSQPINETIESNTIFETNSSMDQNSFYPQVENDINQTTASNIENTTAQELQTPVIQENQNLESDFSPLTDNINIDNNLINESQNVDNVNITDTNLEAEFKKVLPEEESIDNDLMVDINNMEIDPLGTVDVSNNNVYAKLSSNIELPEINDLENVGDVWKF